MGNYVSSYLETYMTNWTNPVVAEPSTFDLSHQYPADVLKALAELSPERGAEITTVNVADCDLTDLPDDLAKLPNVEEIELSWNKLTNLTKLSLCPKLTIIQSVGNPVETLPTSLKQLPELEALTLCQSNLMAVNEEVAELPKLQELSLYSNKIKAVSPTFLKATTGLTELNISVNRIETLAETTFQNTPLLRKLIGHSNLLQTCPKLTHLSKLEEIKLNRNRLVIFPTLGAHAALTEIDLSCNHIQSLPTEVFSRDTLPSLVKLELASNKLTALPDSIGRLPSLAYLGLANNQLKELPLSLYRLPTLLHLNICRNQFAEFPSDMIFLQYSLESLYVSRNQLTTLPPFLMYFSKLKAFSVTGNPLKLEGSVAVETYRTLQSTVRDRNRGKFMGMEDEIMEDEYWKTVWGPYDTEWQGIF